MVNPVSFNDTAQDPNDPFVRKNTDNLYDCFVRLPLMENIPYESLRSIYINLNRAQEH
jgi:hypothetical protein